MAVNRRKKKKNQKPMAFSALNYKILGLGVLLIVIGFTAMRLENEVFGIISLYISPIVIMGGYITVIVAILKREGPKVTQETSATSAS